MLARGMIQMTKDCNAKNWPDNRPRLLFLNVLFGSNYIFYNSIELKEILQSVSFFEKTDFSLLEYSQSVNYQNGYF